MSPQASSLFVAVTLASALASAPAVAAPAAAPGARARVTVPLFFEARPGRAPARAQFVARRPGYALALGDRGATIAVGGSRLRMALAGAARRAPEALAPLAARASHFRGVAPSSWRRDVPLTAAVIYRAVYPGIDLVFRPNADQLVEYDFLVAPGADPSRIGFALLGADRLELDGRGALRVHVARGVLTHQRPVAYQEHDGVRRPVDAAYVVGPRGRVGFALGAYDRARPLVIDPPLSYSTYLGGFEPDAVQAVATDAEGFIYAAGWTMATDFPTKGAYDAVIDAAGGPGFHQDAFVVKLDPTKAGAGSLVYATYVGGSGADRALTLAVGPDGSAYLGGDTTSSDLPLVNPLQTCRNGAGAFVCDFNNGFVAKVGPTGATLEHATYLAGLGVDEVRAVRVGSDGRLFVAGRTSSPADPTKLPTSSAGWFPVTTGAFQTVNRGIFDAFVLALDPGASGAAQLGYSTLIGGCQNEEASALTVDSQGNAAITGFTQSACPGNTFPTAAAVQPTYPGGSFKAFVAKLDASGAALVFSTFLGGTASVENGTTLDGGIDHDAADNLYVTGTTTARDFPTTAGAYRRCAPLHGNGDVLYPCDQATGLYLGAVPPSSVISHNGFVTKFAPSGAVLYSTYLGGDNEDSPFDLAVDADGFAFVVGRTLSTNLSAPATVACAAQPAKIGTVDAFLAVLEPDGSDLRHVTYLGSATSGTDAAYAVAIDPGGHAVLGGETAFTTAGATFPTTAGALQPTQPGASPRGNGFVTRLERPTVCGADLLVRKSASPDPAPAGCGLTYTIHVLNRGTAAAPQVMVTDPLPPGVVLVSATASQGACVASDPVTCALGTIDVDAGAMVTIDVLVDEALAGGALVNTATVDTPLDFDVSDNVSTITTAVGPALDGDGDGAADCVDLCPTDPDAIEPGPGGCGAPAACDADELAAMVIPGMTPAFAPDVHAYTIPSSSSGVTAVTATLCDPSRALYVQSNPATSGATINAWLGGGTIAIAIYDGWTEVGSYTVTVDAALPPPGGGAPGVITSLSAAGLSPAFDPSVEHYTAPAPGGFLGVTATLGDPGLTLHVGGTPVASGVTWPAWAPPGAEVDVVAYDGWIEVARYTIAIE